MNIENQKLALEKLRQMNIPFDPQSLVFLSQEGNLMGVQLLLEAGMNANVPAKEGYLALNQASKNGHLELLKLLVSYGAGLNEKDKFGNSSMYLAFYNNRESAVNLLIESGAVPLTEDEKRKIEEGKVQLEKNLQSDKRSNYANYAVMLFGVLVVGYFLSTQTKLFEFKSGNRTESTIESTPSNSSESPTKYQYCSKHNRSYDPDNAFKGCPSCYDEGDFWKETREKARKF